MLYEIILDAILALSEVIEKNVEWEIELKLTISLIDQVVYFWV